MAYDFKVLSDIDFEDLSRDLVGRELNMRFEAFTQGADGGIDGRHTTATGNVILQAKHYAGSAPPAVIKKMEKERVAIDRLAPRRYVLTTTCKLTPPSKAKLATAVGPALRSQDDIFGPDDLNGLLRKYPDIEKSHLKLWLSSAAVLERILRAASYKFNALALEDIEEKVRVYAPNPSFDQANSKLDQHHLLIIAGPPGVGKTTLAEMLVYSHLADDWQLVAIRSLEDGFASIDDAQKQIFYFDDFLGRVALDTHALAKMDSDLARFIKRVKKSPNARFVLTTRAPIFEEAKRYSEHLADQHLNISKYLLDVGVYTRRIKARILYNHLVAAGTPQTHVDALIESKKLGKIVDHKNYNPRLIELMTEGTRIASYPPAEYPDRFVAALNNPRDLWDIPFRKHIPKTCQHLLMTLFFCNEYGVAIETLREAFEAFHTELSRHYGGTLDPKDFEDALEILEGGFIKIRGTDVSFVNPSVKDYLSIYIDDLTLLGLAARASRRTEWADRVWRHSRSESIRGKATKAELTALTFNFRSIAEAFLLLPVEKRVPYGQSYSLVADGISNTDRLELLAEWWFASRDPRYIELMKSLATNPVGGWNGWRDGGHLIGTIAKFRNNDYYGRMPDAVAIAQVMESGVVRLLKNRTLNSDDLNGLADAEEEWINDVSDELAAALTYAIRCEFEDIVEVVRNIDSESTLEDHAEALTRLAKRAAVPGAILQHALGLVEGRKSELSERAYVSSSPSTRSVDHGSKDTFDDLALSNLFAPLWRRTQ